MRKSLFSRLRPGPGGRTIQDPGILPEWLQVAAFLVGSVGALLLAGVLIYGLVLLALGAL